MRRSYYFIRILILVCLIPLCAISQSGDIKLTQIIPPSPNAAALAKFGEIPVSPYTGLANISIPLYDIKARDLDLPISLSYHSSGIRVAEEASWVGLGWSLLCGGAITRVVRGADDLVNGYPDSYMPSTIDQSSNTYFEPTNIDSVQRDKQFLVDVLQGLEDPEPDIFVYNFNGRSGKFVLNKRTNTSLPFEVISLSKNDLKIEVNLVGTMKYQWVITDENGIKYFFNTPEFTESRTGYGDEEWSADANAPEGQPLNVVSSWYLDSIKSSAGTIINFDYYSSSSEGLGTKCILNRTQIKEHVLSLVNPDGCDVPMNKFTYISSYSEVQNVFLKNIEFPSGKIEFILGDRDDIEPIAGGFPLTYAKKVDQIILYSKEDSGYSPLTTYSFQYSYFESDTTYAGRRLQLLSVRESSGKDSLPPYLFTYNPILLPNKDSKSIDHWGYYNGADNAHVNDMTYGDMTFNGTLVPPLTVYIPALNVTRTYDGANRDPNSEFTQACILKSIQYPTGGISTFEFESNDYYSPIEKIIEVPKEEYAEKYGPNTGIQNVRSDTLTINLIDSTMIKVYTSVQCYNSNSCLTNGEEYEYDVARIQSIDSLNSYEQWIGYGLNYNNQEDSELKETDIYLPPGKYKFTVFSDQGYLSRMFVDWSEKSSIIINNQLGPGLRVKRILSYDGISHDNDQSALYSYIKNDDSVIKSTGRLMTKPVYLFEKEYFSTCSTNQQTTTYAKIIVRNSNSVIPISSAASGSPLGYDEVTVTKTGSGKTVYEYLNHEDALSYPYLPNVPTSPFFGNGLLSRETNFGEMADGSYKKIQENLYSYSIGNRISTVRGMVLPSSDLVLFHCRLPQSSAIQVRVNKSMIC